MKTKLLFTLTALLVLAEGAHAQGTAFTYQGRLTTADAPVNGTVELQCTLWNALSGGTQVTAATPATTVVTPTNGLFTVPLDFGTAAFDGSDRYLQIEARTTIGPFTLLTPRQKITATPYALLAGKLSGTVASSGLGGTYGNALTFSNVANVFIGNGAGLTALNASQLTGALPTAALSNAWKIGGNAATTAGVNFLGTTDNQPLELKANGQRALRLEPIFTITNSGPGYSVIYSNAPNLIGGSPINIADAGVIGSFIGGGGMGGYYVDPGTGYVFSGPFPNRVSANFATIAGGYGNTIQKNADGSAIGGGTGNTIQTNAYASTIGGGSGNTIQTNASVSTIGGGSGNTIETNADRSTIAGGAGNKIMSDSEDATIGGGSANLIRTNASYSTIAGGYGNRVYEGATYASIGGGTGNYAEETAAYSTVGGGRFNQITLQYGTISGGDGNAVTGYGSTVAGGLHNRSDSFGGSVGGGTNNWILGAATYATIPGGYNNRVSGSYGFAAGRRAAANHIGAFVWADSTDADFASSAANQFLVRAAGGVVLSDNTPSLSFGTTTRQMLDFYGLGFGMGVQTATLYARSNTRFSWFRNGTHSDLENNPGAGGTVLMTLTGSGLTVNGTFVSVSDRNAKEQFEPLNPREVLDKLVTLPLSKWSYKADSATRHVGPMAQDFYAAFGVGPDDKHIATVDADGVALAAIQGLNQKLEETRAENADLKQRLEKLEQLMNHKDGGAR